MLTVILTGGQSRRMGRDKALLPLGDSCFSLTLARRFASLGPVVFSVDCPGRFPTAEFPELSDAFPGAGPMNGLVSGFRYAKEEEYLLLLATDMPFSDPALARILQAAIGDADVCRFERERLFALYRRSVLPLAEELLSHGENALHRLHDGVRTVTVPRPAGDSLRNINTPEDYRSLSEAFK